METSYKPPVQTGGEAEQAFLALLPANHSGALCNFFHNACREGQSTPKTIINWIHADIARRLHQQPSTARKAALDGLSAAITQQPIGAAVYANRVIAWQQLSPQERLKKRAEENEQHKRERMAILPPTEKQLAFLTTLGHDSELPGSMAEASALIDQLKEHSLRSPVREKAGLGRGRANT